MNTLGSSLAMSEEAPSIPLFSTEWYTNAGAALACIVGASIAAGLTMGLVSIDKSSIEQLLLTETEDCDTEEERKELIQLQKCARRIKPLKSNHHLLLVTLLLLNSGVNEALPIFLDNIVPSWLAIILSVSLVLFFGEIIPSALFTGPNQLQIASSFSYLVWFMIYLFYPVSYPISKLLDCCLGKEHGVGRHQRAELKGLLRMHTNLQKTIQRKDNAEKAM